MSFGGKCCCQSCSYHLQKIPIVGWVAAVWVTMFNGNQGVGIDGGVAEDSYKDCQLQK